MKISSSVPLFQSANQDANDKLSPAGSRDCAASARRQTRYDLRLHSGVGCDRLGTQSEICLHHAALCLRCLSQSVPMACQEEEPADCCYRSSVSGLSPILPRDSTRKSSPKIAPLAQPYWVGRRRQPASTLIHFPCLPRKNESPFVSTLGVLTSFD